ncbi:MULTISPECIES: S8 family peptidase [unclassified Sphingomonas]|uniref:S8 family peptidase n=1 Tax=unclassified Sphingomonas TaxID=196159 RepID=UPI00082FCE1B|nr:MULTISPECIES: S8 family peptidase [unclassified Sphingomonas]
MLATPALAKRGEPIEDQYICVFDKSVAKSNVAKEASRAVKEQGGKLKHVYFSAMQGFTVNLPAQAVERMKAFDRTIAYCEQDRVVTIPEDEAQATAQPGGSTIQATQTVPWGITRVGGGAITSGATAWVLDSGIDLDHPDLNVDVTRSASFVGDPSPNDGNGHGTHVAGTIAACNNGIGVVGVAPCTRVVAVRVLDSSGRGSNSGIIAGIDYVAANGRPGDIANMSLGGGASSALDAAVINAASTGVRFVLAAGNSAVNAATTSPARANGPNVFTVSAFDRNGRFATFSNFGNPPIDVAEPGVSIPSTYLNGGYATLSGTSMAAPHLSGLLLIGSVRNGGRVTNDPDGIPDIIGVR